MTLRCGWLVAVSFIAGRALGGEPAYTSINLGKPEGAYSAIAVRMNNLGHVAGWSQYFGQGEPSLKGWVWTAAEGFTILPPPPGFYLGRLRAMDINDSGVVAGDGGYDTGLAWRYEAGAYTVTGGAEGMPGAYLGGINNAGHIAGTAKDSSISTPDYAWLDVNGGALITVTPNGGRGTDVNDAGQVAGYTQGSASGFEAFRWDPSGGLQFLGTLGLAYSFANRINNGGQVVGYALSASGNTKRAWIYTDGQGMQELPAPYQNAGSAISINNQGHVVGITTVSGPDIHWLWTGGNTAENVNVLEVKDINDAGQLLVEVFDNNVADFRNLLLTPPGVSGIPGDIDGDGDVDLTDHAAFVACLAGPVSPPPSGCAAADINGDLFVDLVDAGAFANLYTGN